MRGLDNASASADLVVKGWSKSLPAEAGRIAKGFSSSASASASAASEVKKAMSCESFSFSCSVRLADSVMANRSPSPAPEPSSWSASLIEKLGFCCSSGPAVYS